MALPLSERQDYYSKRRVASQDVILWLAEGLTDKRILKKLMIQYGFGKLFLDEVKRLI